MAIGHGAIIRGVFRIFTCHVNASTGGDRGTKIGCERTCQISTLVCGIRWQNMGRADRSGRSRGETGRNGRRGAGGVPRRQGAGDLKHLASTRFWECYNALPDEVKRLARENFALLKCDPSHPSLQFKFVKHGMYRSVRIGLHYRALGVPVKEGVQWFWIGSRAEYDKRVG